MSGLAGLDLGKQIGPLPMGAWVAAVAGGIGIMIYKKKNAAATATADATPGVDTSGTPGVGTGAVGGYVDNSTPAPSTPDASAITDNQSWGRQATNYLIAQGYDPAVSDSAVRKYLASSALSVSEYALIKVVLLKYGTPPEGLAQLPPDAPVTPVAAPPPLAPPVSVPAAVTPAPAPPPPVAAPAHVYYTVRPGDSLSRIAARYPQSWITWQSIYNNNRGIISNPNLIHPGQVLMIY